MRYRLSFYLLLGLISLGHAAADSPQQKIVYTEDTLIQGWIERIGGGFIGTQNPQGLANCESIPHFTSGFTPSTTSGPSTITLTDGMQLLRQGQALRPAKPADCKLAADEEKRPCCCKTQAYTARYEAIYSSNDTDRPIHSHGWMDVSIAMSMIIALSESLSEAFPELAQTIQANSQSYLVELEALDRWIFEQTEPLIEAKAEAPSDDWLYFSRRYGLPQPTNSSRKTALTAPGKEDYSTHMRRLVVELKAAQKKAPKAEASGA